MTLELSQMGWLGEGCMLLLLAPTLLFRLQPRQDLDDLPLLQRLWPHHLASRCTFNPECSPGDETMDVLKQMTRFRSTLR